MTFGDLFCGGGGFSLGAIAAGLTPAWAVESDSATATVYSANLGNHVTVKDIRDVDPRSLEPVDVLLASPECQTYSRAFKLNKGRKPNRDDAHQVGDAIGLFLRTLKPDVFILENVREYASQPKSGEIMPFKKIQKCLLSLGYFIDAPILNAADFGVASSRERLFLIATRRRDLMLYPKWRRLGWYEAIEDLIPGLPPSKFAEWQEGAVDQARNKKRGLFVVDGKALRAPTRAYVMQGKDMNPVAPGGYRPPTVRFGYQPLWAVTASCDRQTIRCELGPGDVRKVTIPAIARMQTFPDDYEWPARSATKKLDIALSMRIIGNSVPPLMAQRLIEAVV